jgi:hypothetical protein
MNIDICVSDPADALEKYRPRTSAVRWQLVVSGYWADDMYHSGHIAYYIARTAPGHWVMDAVERNAELDGVTEEDIEAGRLNDDQLQALWGTTLEEAQAHRYQRIVASCTAAPKQMTAAELASTLYERVCAAGGKVVSEPDDVTGLLTKKRKQRGREK